MKYFVALFLVLFYVASPKVSAVWTNPNYKDRTYSKIAVFAISDDDKNRKLFEAKVADRLRAKRINAVRGNTIFPDLPAARALGEQGILKALRDKGIDGVITMSLVKTDQKIEYKKGETYSVAAGSKGLGTYWVTHYETMSQPGYLESKKVFLIESNGSGRCEDLKGGVEERRDALVWKGQSELVNPATNYDAAVDFAKPLVKHLLRKKLVKRKK